MYWDIETSNYYLDVAKKTILIPEIIVVIIERKDIESLPDNKKIWFYNFI